VSDYRQQQEQDEHQQYLEGEKMNVYAKLMQARLKLQAAELKKTGHNKFAGYYYFELGDFLPAVQKIFSELGLCGVVSYGHDIATLTITSIIDGGTVLITSPMSSAALKGCHDVQNLGAVQTYIRRYLWVAAMEIVEHDALDSTTGKSEPERKAAKSVARDVLDSLTPEQKSFMQDTANHIIAAIGMDEIDKAHEIFYRKNLDNEEKMAIWALLDSKMRSAIKSYDDSIKEKQ
jgi:predicted Fe-S protein YdhL (DUF1289 family)